MNNTESSFKEDYQYPGNIEDLKKVWIREPHFIPTVTVYSLAFLIGIIGNFLVIFAVLGDRKARSVTSTFMVSLAIADILFLSVCVPYETTRYVVDHWKFGVVLCKFSGLTEMLSATASILNLSAVSVERFIVIVLPMRSRRWCTSGNTKKILLVVWTVAVILASPTLVVMGVESTTYSQNNTSVVIHDCADIAVDDDLRLGFAIYRMLIMFVLPTFVMCICYAGVIYALWISSRQLTQLTAGSRSTNSSTISLERTCLRHHPLPQSAIVTGSPYRMRKFNIRNGVRDRSVDVLTARRQVIKMLIAIIAVFFLCWGPKLVLQVIRRHELEIMFTKPAFVTKIVLDCLPYIQSCLNPIIYGFMSRNFRRSMVVACRRYYCLCHLSKCLSSKKVIFLDYEMDSKMSNGTTQTRMSGTVRNSGSSDEYQCALTGGKCTT